MVRDRFRSGHVETHPSPRDPPHATHAGDRGGNRVRVHGPRRGAEPRRRLGERRRVCREPDRDRPGRLHSGERTPHECDRPDRDLDHERRLRRDAGPCRGLGDQRSHALRFRRRPRIISRWRRNDRVPGRSAQRLPRRRIAGSDPIGEREAGGDFREPESVRVASHGPPDRRSAADAFRALSGRLGLPPTGSLDRDECNAGRACASHPGRRAARAGGRCLAADDATRDARRDRVCPRERRGGPIVTGSSRAGHRGGDRPPRLRGDEPRGPCPCAGDCDPPESRRVPRHGGRGLRSPGRPPRPHGSDPRIRARDRRLARGRFARAPRRSPEPRDPLTTDSRGGPRAPHLRGGRSPGGRRSVPPRGPPHSREGGHPILIGRRAFAGLLLCAFLLGATWPILAALPGVPTRILAGDAYLVTQGSGPYSVNESLVQNLTGQPWASVVSPEILSLGTVHGEPVVVRAADPAALFSLEGGAWVQAATVSDRTAVAGEGLVRRLGLAVGDDVTLVGFAMGRLLSGLGATGFHSIRIRTTDPTALLTFLRGFGASVHVTGPDLSRVDIASDPPTDERISNLILRTGIGGAPRDYLASAVAEATNSVGVVADGIAALLGILVAFGIHAVQARAFADRVPAVGVLRAIGAGNRWMRRRLLAESLPLAAGAAILGAGLGFLAETSLQPNASLVIFGHEVLVSFDLATFALVVLAVMAISTLSGLLLLRRAMADRPVESIRETPAVASPQSLEAILRG